MYLMYLFYLYNNKRSMFNVFDYLKEKIFSKMSPKDSKGNNLMLKTPELEKGLKRKRKNKSEAKAADEAIDESTKIEGITNTIPSKENTKDPKQQKSTFTDDTSEYFMEEEDEAENKLLLKEIKNPMYTNNTNTHSSSNTKSLKIISASNIPLLYFFLSCSLIPTILFINSNSQQTPSILYYSYLGKAKVPLLSYFALQRVAPVVYHMINLISGLLGLLTVVLVLLYMKRNISNKKFIANISLVSEKIKLYIACFFGILAFVLTIGSAIFAITDSSDFQATFYKELGSRFSFYEFIFLTKVFFLLTWCVFILLMNSPNEYDNNSSSNPANKEEMAWYNYKLISMIYLTVFSLIYFITRLNIIRVSQIQEIIPFIAAIFPYICHIMFDLVVLTFCFVLKNDSVLFSDSDSDSRNRSRRYENLIKNNEKNIL